MQVGAIGSGDLLRILEAILKLPTPSEARSAASAIPAPAPAREDEAVLQYGAVSQFAQTMGNLSAAVSPAISTNGISVQQTPEAAAEFAKLDPAIAAAVAATVMHSAAHVASLEAPYASYSIHNDGSALAQAALAASVYAAAFSQTADCGLKIDTLPVRAASDLRNRKGAMAWGSAAWGGTRRLWRRAPLLVLLLGWLATGLCAGMAAILFAASAAPVNAIFNLWAVGFLAIAGFGFYARVRNIRFRAGPIK